MFQEILRLIAELRRPRSRPQRFSENRSATSDKLIKIGAKVVSHGRYIVVVDFTMFNQGKTVRCAISTAFGEHTFFLDRNGLNIVEPAEAAAGAAAQSAKVVNLASWSDDDPTGLELHEPEATDIVITFESRH